MSPFLNKSKAPMYVSLFFFLLSTKSSLLTSSVSRICFNSVCLPTSLCVISFADITLAELRAGRCRSDFGTNIRCVTEHLQKHRIRNALMVTDGFVGKPIGADHDTLAKARLGVAYLGGGICTTDLAEVTRHTTTLNH